VQTPLPTIPEAQSPLVRETLGRILLAEDDFEVRKYVERVLSESFQVFSVSDGEAALQAVREYRPDLLVSDVIMPTLDGLGLVRQLRANPQTQMLPIILLSGRTGDDPIVEGLEAGADDYLVKPFNARELIARVSVHLEMARLRKQAAEHEQKMRAQAEGAFANQKKVEAQLRRYADELATFVETAAIGLHWAGQDGIIQWANDAEMQMLGYSRSEYIGRHVSDFHVDMEWAFEMIDKLNGGETLHEYPAQLRCKDGSVKDVLIDCNVLFEDGRFVHTQSFTRDITKQIAAERALREAKIKLEEYANELEKRVAERTASLKQVMTQMEEFSYSVSHDLRAPIRSIHGFTRILIDEFGPALNSEARGFLDRILRASERMDRMTLDLLALSKVACSEASLQTVNPEETINEIILGYAPIQESKAEIEIAPLHQVHAFEPLLHQALSNILGNAVKFVPPGTIPHVRISSEKRDSSVRLWIEDNGIGINPQYFHRIFGMFERLHPEGQYEGAGIGLSIARKAIERMGGTVGVESDGKHGSRFWVELRAAEAK
jgi:PAS domain S-box-containing protein